MRIKNDIKFSNFYRDFYWFATKVVDQGFGRILNGLKPIMASADRSYRSGTKTEVSTGLKHTLRLPRKTSLEHTGVALEAMGQRTTAGMLFEPDRAYRKLLEEKNHAQKAQMQSQNHLAQVAEELSPTLNELSSLAQVSANHWRDDRRNLDGNEFAERLDFTSRYVLSIVQDFADLAKLKSGKTALNQQEIDPNELIKQAETIVQAGADRLLVDLQCDLNSRNILIFGDLNRIRQMLVRALFVAIECVGENGFVNLRSALNSSGQLLFCLEFGGGKKALIYQRLSSEGKKTFGQNLSSNWGYDLVSKLVELHDGLIVMSQDDFGTQSWEMKFPQNRVSVLAANN